MIWVMEVMKGIKIIDTHSHLCDEAFDRDLPQVLERAKEVGVKAVISVSETLEDAKKTLELSARFPQILPAVGLYPTHLSHTEAQELIRFIRENRDHIAGIGEVGLDYWKVKDEAGREIQRNIFLDFVRLAAELDLPLNVHSRSSGRQAISLLKEAGARRVQLHAFDAKAATAMEGVEAGYYFSIPPSVVRSRQKQKLVSRLPLDSLLAETDSPVLGPEPGVRNEPANASLVIKAVSEIKGIREEEVSEVLYQNTLRLYGALEIG